MKMVEDLKFELEQFKQKYYEPLLKSFLELHEGDFNLYVAKTYERYKDE